MRAVGVVVLAAVVIAGIAVAVTLAGDRGPSCPLAEPDQARSTSIAGYRGEQLENAVAILRTADGMGLDPRAGLLGVMAAMGESSLRVLAYGDYETNGVLNPDGTPTTSIGLFQQQEWWGTTEQRLDPVASATLFFEHLVEVEGWETRPASQVIHEVQVNDDPSHYARFQDAAEQVTEALTPCIRVG